MKGSDDDVQTALQTPTPSPSPPGASLEDLFRRHGRSVLRAAWRVTGSESDAEDVVQTVFLRLLDHGHLATLGPEAGPYLRRAATNAALDVLRRRASARAVPIEDEGDELPDRAAGPAGRLRQGELRAELRRALAELPERAAEMFTLRYFEGWSNGEIAGAAGTSAGVVAVTLHRARRTLQKSLDGFLGDLS